MKPSTRFLVCVGSVLDLGATSVPRFRRTRYRHILAGSPGEKVAGDWSAVAADFNHVAADFNGVARRAGPPLKP